MMSPDSTEVSGERDPDKAAKVATARNPSIAAINNAATWGRWAFIEIADPLDANSTIIAAKEAGDASI